MSPSPGHRRHRIPRCAKRHGVARPQTAGHVVNGQGHVVHDAWKAVHVEVAPDRWKKPREMADTRGRTWLIKWLNDQFPLIKWQFTYNGLEQSCG